MKLESIFGPYATRLQGVIDSKLDQFAPTWYQRYFSFAPTQQSLNFVSVIGRSRIEAAASIVNRDSATPLRSRAGLDKMSGEIPAIKEMFKMSESDYRDFLGMQALNLDDATKTTQLLDYLFGDVKKVGNAAHKRLDIMALEAVSKGQVSLTIDNNPDGLVLGSAVDLLMPTGNKSNAAVSWATAASATPLADIQAVIDAANARGIVFEKMLVSRAVWLNFKKTKEVIDTMGAFFYGPKVQGNPIAVTTLDRINDFMSSNQLPMIEIVEEVVGIEKDGLIGTLKPFSQVNAVFIPAGQLGVIKNAVPIEKLQPVGKVNYGEFNRALISKWSENEPFGEWTKVELNAMPAVEAIDSIYLLTAIL